MKSAGNPVSRIKIKLKSDSWPVYSWNYFVAGIHFLCVSTGHELIFTTTFYLLLKLRVFL